MYYKGNHFRLIYTTSLTTKYSKREYKLVND